MNHPQKSRRKILLLTSNPKGTTRRRLDEEVRDISEGLERARKRNEFRFIHRWAVRPRDLQRAMLEEKPQIIHFSGHSDAKAGLFLEDETGNAQVVSKEALASLFSLFSQECRLECVILNGCYSQIQAEAIAQHVPHVIGIKQSVNEQSAIDFSVGFYDALGNGKSVIFAFNNGKVAMQLREVGNRELPVMLRGKVIKQRERTQETTQKSNRLKRTHLISPTVRYKKTTFLSPTNIRVSTYLHCMWLISAIGILILAFGKFIQVNNVNQSNRSKIASQSTANNFLIYENEIYAVRAAYPENWEVQELGNTSDLTLYDPVTKEVVKFYPSGLLENNSSPHITIKIFAISEKTTLDEYTNFFIKNILESLPKAKLIESRPIILANEQGHQIVYEGELNDTYLRLLSTWVIKDSKLYQIVYSAQPREYLTFEDAAYNVVDSFRTLEIP